VLFADIQKEDKVEGGEDEPLDNVPNLELEHRRQYLAPPASSISLPVAGLSLLAAQLSDTVFKNWTKKLKPRLMCNQKLHYHKKNIYSFTLCMRLMNCSPPHAKMAYD
jgi:hypothetical protein